MSQKRIFLIFVDSFLNFCKANKNCNYSATTQNFLSVSSFPSVSLNEVSMSLYCQLQKHRGSLQFGAEKKFFVQSGIETSRLSMVYYRDTKSAQNVVQRLPASLQSIKETQRLSLVCDKDTKFLYSLIQQCQGSVWSLIKAPSLYNFVQRNHVLYYRYKVSLLSGVETLRLS